MCFSMICIKEEKHLPIWVGLEDGTLTEFIMYSKERLTLASKSLVLEWKSPYDNMANPSSCPPSWSIPSEPSFALD